MSSYSRRQLLKDGAKKTEQAEQERVKQEAEEKRLAEQHEKERKHKEWLQSDEGKRWSAEQERIKQEAEEKRLAEQQREEEAKRIAEQQRKEEERKHQEWLKSEEGVKWLAEQKRKKDETEEKERLIAAEKTRQAKEKQWLDKLISPLKTLSVILLLIETVFSLIYIPKSFLSIIVCLISILIYLKLMKDLPVSAFVKTRDRISKGYKTTKFKMIVSVFLVPLLITSVHFGVVRFTSSIFDETINGTNDSGYKFAVYNFNQSEYKSNKHNKKFIDLIKKSDIFNLTMNPLNELPVSVLYPEYSSTIRVTYFDEYTAVMLIDYLNKCCATCFIRPKANTSSSSFSGTESRNDAGSITWSWWYNPSEIEKIMIRLRNLSLKPVNFVSEPLDSTHTDREYAYMELQKLTTGAYVFKFWFYEDRLFSSIRFE